MLNQILVTLQTWLKPQALSMGLGREQLLAQQRQQLSAQLEQMSRKQEDIDSQLRELNRQLQTNTNPIRKQRLLCQVAILTTEERALLRQSGIVYKQLQRLAQITPLLQEERLISMVDTKLYEAAMKQVMIRQEQEQQVEACQQLLDEQLSESEDPLRAENLEELALELEQRFSAERPIAAEDALKQSPVLEPIINEQQLQEQDHDAESNTPVGSAAA